MLFNSFPASRMQLLPCVLTCLQSSCLWRWGCEHGHVALRMLHDTRLRCLLVFQYLPRMSLCMLQAASGAGAAAMEELKEQTRDVIEGRPAKPVIFPQQYAFNLFR